MKLFTFWKNLKIVPLHGKEEVTYQLMHNNEIIPSIKVYYNKLATRVMKILRHLQTAQYEDVFLMKSKKAFNTIGFQQEYDVVICDRSGTVIWTEQKVKSGFISPYFPNGYAIYFMVVGSINHYGINEKDSLRISRNLEEKFKGIKM